MKKRSFSLISLLLLVCIVVTSFTACDALSGLFGGDNTGEGGGGDAPSEHVHVDYVGQAKLDMNDTSTLKQEVTVKIHIDGDTTHFYVPESIAPDGVMKARYLAVNTPESTGSIEEWGKTASNFTKEKLASAVSIVVESNDDKWNYDGNGRFLVWVWYQPSEGAEYRNLNLEILQSGLGVGSSASEGKYGESCVAAIAQAKIEKLYMFSDELDPTYPYGAAKSVTLKELRTKIEEYNGDKVAFEGVVSYNSDWTAFVEEYDPETDMYYGIQVFYGYKSALTTVLAQGNRVRIVGSVSEFSGTYQVSGLAYQPMRPNEPDNTAVISTGNALAFKETTAETFTGEKTILIDDVDTTFDYEKLAVSTSISMKDLQVIDIYTTTKETSADKGAMTLTCKSGNITVDVRTAVLYDSEGNLVTEDYFEGKTIDVKGVVDYFDLNNTGDGTYQIKVYTLDEITVH